MNHLGDANKISETPRTDAAYARSTGAGIYELFKESQDIERELNAASKERDDALMMLGMYRMKSDEQNQRIKRMEEAGDAMMSEPCEYTFEQWIKAKEAKP